MPSNAPVFAFWDPGLGVAPSSAPVPWRIIGAGAEAFDGHEATLEADGATTCAWALDLPYVPRSVEIEIEVAASVTVTAGWTSPFALVVDLGDEQGAGYLAFGETLAWVTSSGVAITFASEGWGGVIPRLFRLRLSPDGWTISDGQRTLAQLPLRRIGGSLLHAPGLVLGCIPAPGEGQTILRSIRVAVNAAMPPAWRLERFGAALTGAVRNQVFAALQEGLVGLLDGPRQALMDLMGAFTAASVPLLDQPIIWDGSRLPNTAHPAWTLYRSGQCSVVRERVRFAGDGGGFVGAEYTWVGDPVPEDAAWSLAATWTCTDSTPTAQLRLGPIMQIATGNKVVTATMRELAGGQWMWVLTNASTTGAVTALGTDWQVYVGIAHRVEIAVFGQRWVVLFVDNRPVDFLDVGDFPASGDQRATLGVASAAGLPLITADVEDVAFRVYLSDSGRRRELEQMAIDRGLFASGCERPDLLERWLASRWQVLAGRGTTQGIIVDLRRLCCSTTPEIIVEEEPGGWVLEESWPDITPVFLDEEGVFRQLFVEFTATTPAWTPMEFMRWCRRYMVPVSRLDDVYYLTLVCVLTGASSIVAGYRRLPVDRSAYFEAGDTVLLRSADDTTRDETTVYQVVDGTTIDVEDTGAAATSDWRLCKVLGRS